MCLCSAKKARQPLKSHPAPPHRPLRLQPEAQPSSLAGLKTLPAAHQGGRTTGNMQLGVGNTAVKAGPSLSDTSRHLRHSKPRPTTHRPDHLPQRVPAALLGSSRKAPFPGRGGQAAGLGKQAGSLLPAAAPAAAAATASTSSQAPSACFYCQEVGRYMEQFLVASILSAREVLPVNYFVSNPKKEPLKRPFELRYQKGIWHCSPRSVAGIFVLFCFKA